MNENNWNSILSIILVAIIGPCVFILQPGIVQVLIEALQYSDIQAGQIASVENAGLAIATVAVAIFINKLDWLQSVRWALILAALGNMCSIFFHEFIIFAGLRFITALGGGCMIAITFAMLSKTVKTDRNMGLLITLLLTYGGLGLLVMPSAMDFMGIEGIFLFFTLFNCSGLVVLKWLPSFAPSDKQQLTIYSISPPHRVITMCALLGYNIAIGMVWVYLFLVGLQSGMEEQAVANALTVSQFAGIAGALVVTVLQTAIGRAIPLLFGIWGGAFGVFLLIENTVPLIFWLGVCTFNGLWNLSVPYIFAMLSKIDENGRSITQGTAMQFIGFAVGPFIASIVVGSQSDYATVNTIAIVLFALVGVALIPVLKKLNH